MIDKEEDDFFVLSNPVCFNCSGDGQYYFNVNVHKLINRTIEIIAVNNEEFSNKSSGFRVLVLDFYDPCLNDSIRINPMMPSKSETKMFRDYIGPVKGEPMLVINRVAFSELNYEIDLAERAIVGDARCPIVGYTIYKVKDAKSSNLTVGLSSYSSLLLMDPFSGALRINNFETALDWFVLLGYDNGARVGVLDFVRITITAAPRNDPPNFKDPLSNVKIYINE